MPGSPNTLRKPWAAAVILCLLLPAAAAAWVICTECDPPVREPADLCPECGSGYMKHGGGLGLVYVALEDKDRSLIWEGPDSLCRILTPEGLLVGDPGEDRRIPWSDVSFYLPNLGVARTRSGNVVASDTLKLGDGNPWCPRPPRLPARLLLRPWVEKEWLFTPRGETIPLSRVRVLATGWAALQEGKREWARRTLGRRALQPLVDRADREKVARLPEPVFTEEPVYPEIPGVVPAGRVLVDILVGEDGRPICVVSLQPGATSESLQMAAIEAAYQWTFKPARKGRRALAVWLPVPFTFRAR